MNINLLLQSIQPKNFIKFMSASTLASIMTWWVSFNTAEAYNKISYSKEIIFGIAIAFTILYYLIGFCKMIDDDNSSRSST